MPGYLQLPDLAMFWECMDCGEIWRVVGAGRSPGSPLEFNWVRDPNQLVGRDELGHPINAGRS